MSTWTEREALGPRPTEHVPGNGRFRRLKERKLPGTKGTK